MNNFTSIQDLFFKSAKKYHLGAAAEASYICTLFMKIMDEIFKKVAKKPQSFIKEAVFYKGKIKVTVQNSSVAQEIYLRSEYILKKINEDMGKLVVKELSIKIG